VELKGLSQAATEALLALNDIAIVDSKITGSAGLSRWARGVNAIFDDIEKQKQAIDATVASLEKENLQYDENAQRLEELRRQYKYMADSDLQRIIDAENKQAQDRERATQDAKRQAEERKRAADEAAQAEMSSLEMASSLTGRGNTAAQQAAADATVAAAAQVVEKAASTISKAELTLRVIPEPQPEGQRVVLSQQQLYEIASTVVRMLRQSRSIST
jgi:hypothetical protein